MDEVITAAEANRGFSRILRGVREGQRFVVTSHGRPVARIVPLDAAPGDAGPRRSLLARLDGQPVVAAGRWSRDALYGRGE
jgi:prevent-host-death family protein